METLLRDMAVAIRHLKRRAAFSLMAIVTLAIGVAAITVVFSMAWSALLRPPPFPAADRLLLIYRTSSEQNGRTGRWRWSYARFDALRRQTRAFESVASFGPASWPLGDARGVPEQVDAEVVSDAYFATLGVRAQRGRTFLAEENATPGTHPVAVLSHGLWSRRYGGDPDIVGRTVLVSGEPLTVVGIMPPGFAGLSGDAELWIPSMMAPRVSYPEYLTTDQNFISVIGRLRAGVTRAQAAAELAQLGPRIEEELPDETDVPTAWSATSAPLGDVRISGGNRTSLLLLLGAVGFLLLLACANLAALGLAHAATRRQEVSVRLALGAGRSAIARLHLMESLALGLAGGCLGIILAAAAVRVVRPPVTRAGPVNMYGAVGEFAQPAIDLHVLAFSIVVTFLVIALTAVLPALLTGRQELASALRGRSGDAGRSSSGLRPQSVLVVAEIALALVLSVGSGLLLVSLRQLRAQPIGFRPDHVLTFVIQPSEARYGTDEAPALVERVLDAATAVPGVRSATVDACTPLAARCASSTLYIAGKPEPPPGQAPFVLRHYVGEDHFATLDIPLVRGRAFRATDRRDRPGVAIINQTAARRFWPGTDPIGQRIWFGGGSSFNSPDSAAEIVGIVGDVPYDAIDIDQLPSIYTPYRQFTYASRTVMVRTEGDPLALVPAIRSAVARVDGIPISDVRTMENRLGDSWARTRFNASLLGAFAVVALLLAAGGVYGVVVRSVQQRTREIGIRMAVGAAPGDVLRLIVGGALRLAALGVLVGIVLALALSRFMDALVFGVAATDVRVLGAQAAVMFIAVLLASLGPARRALAVDPLTSLRAD